jgi:GNAT superfamily N-acetyltransferase
LGSGGGETDGRVREVYVVPAYRRRGIARTLVGLALAEAKAAGVDRVTLGASAMGRALYASLGFVAKPDEMVYAEPIGRARSPV